jgi:predicted transcriptional regulator
MVKPSKREEATLNVDISKETKEKLDEYCRKNGLKIKWVVERALDEYLSKHSASE